MSRAAEVDQKLSTGYRKNVRVLNGKQESENDLK